MRFPTLALLILAACPAFASQTQTTVRAKTSAGKPIQGVRVFVKDKAATTDAKGHTDLPGEGWAMGIAPDGRIAIGDDDDVLTFGKHATITLNVVDGHGRPAKGKRLTITPNPNNTKLERVGVIAPPLYLPDGMEPFLSRVSDDNGKIVFPKLPRGENFRITTLVGFDDPMHYLGVVTPGQTATVVLADDYELTGQVLRAGKPVPNIPVYISDTGHGHMSGYPGTVLRTVKTDQQGRYRVTNLPNCAFNVSLGNISEVLQMPCALFAKTTGEKTWTSLGIHDTVSDEKEGRSWSMDKTAELGQLQTTCDFRILKPTRVTFEVLNPSRRSLKGCSIMLLGPDGTGRGRGLEALPPYRFTTTPGHYRVEFWDANERATRLMSLDLKEGDDRAIKLAVPKRKSRR